MYPLPLDFDETVFVGCSLDMVGIGAFSTVLEFSGTNNFAGGVRWIQVRSIGQITFACDGSSYTGDAELPQTMTPLVGLLRRAVTNVQRVGSSSLSLKLDGGELMLIGEKTSRFECYTIGLPGGLKIVV
jgi:hypothetical protein